MPEQEIYSNFRSHWDNDGDIFPEDGSGNDIHSITIPAGKVFTRYDLKIEANTILSNANVEIHPAPGATGNQDIKVRWNFNRLGKIAYTLRAYADDNITAPIEVAISSTDWVRNGIDAIKQRKELKLKYQGADASAYVNVFLVAKGLPPLKLPDLNLPDLNLPDTTAKVAVGDDVLIGVTIAGTIVALAFILAIVIICLFAIHSDYYVDLEYSRKGPFPFDDQFEIILKPKA